MPPRASKWVAPRGLAKPGQMQPSKHRARCCWGPQSGWASVQLDHDEATRSTGEPLLNFAPTRNSRPQATVKSGGGARTPKRSGAPWFRAGRVASGGPGRPGTAKAGCPASAGVPRGGRRSLPPLEPVRAKGKGSQGMRPSRPKSKGIGPSRRRRRLAGALNDTQAVGRRDVGAGVRPHAR